MPLHHLLRLLLVLLLKLWCIRDRCLLMFCILLHLKLLPFLRLSRDQLVLLLLVLLIRLNIPGIYGRWASNRWKLLRMNGRSGIRR
jgi:hypothetical protein